MAGAESDQEGRCALWLWEGRAWALSGCEEQDPTDVDPTDAV